MLTVSHVEVPWRQLAGCGTLLAPAGGRLRRYRRRHVVSLRLWRRLHSAIESSLPEAAARLGHRIAALVLPLWRLGPGHVAAEAAAVHRNAGDHAEGRRAVAAAVAALLREAVPLPESEPGRVLMLIPSLAAGGAERQLVLCARGLAQKGWQVEVVAKHLAAPPGSSALRPDLVDIAVEAIAAEQEGGEFLDDAVLDLPPPARELVVRLHGLIRRRRPAVVHAWMDEMSAWGGLAAVLAGVPRVILAGRNLAPDRFGLPQPGALWAALRCLADHPGVSLTNNSNAGAVDYARWLGIAPGRIGVLRNGFVPMEPGDGTRWRRRLGIPLAAPVVGGLFRLAWEKNPMLWLDAAAILAARHPAMHFVIFGEGPLRQSLQRRSEQLGLSGRLHLPGVTLGRRDALAALDVFLLTSRYEGTPNVALECQALGLALVATDAGGLCEALADRQSVVAADADCLAEAVTARLGCRAPERGEWLQRHFGLDRMLSETEALYRSEIAP